MNTVFDIEQKQDSAEKLLAVADKETKYILFADEFNDVARKAVESAIHNIELDFSWSNFKNQKQYNVNGIKQVHLLRMQLKEDWILEAADEVWLLIDRYKPKRTIRNGGIKLKSSGFKHAIYPDPDNPKRPSEILITGKDMILDFGQAFYFRNVNEFESLALGYGTKNNHANRSWVYLRFRIKVKKGDKTYYSNSKGVLEMILKYEDTVGKTLGYKLV